MKVLSFNIQCDHPKYDERLQSIMEFIKSQNPDIIALQEVKYGSYDKIINFFNDYFCELSDKVKYHRLYGELILSKYPIEKSEYFTYKHTVNQRGITIYNIKDFVVCTTHLEHISIYS